MQLLFVFTLINSVNAMCEGAQCCEKGEWINNLPSCEELQREGKCGGCFKFHVSPNPETLYCCNKHYSSDRKLEEKPVQEKPAVKADPNQTCGDHCTKYLNDAFNHGITPDDMSSWCTDGLNLCYSGNCMDDCKFNFHDVRLWNNVDCNQVCQGAMGAEQKEQKTAVAEQKVEVQTESKADAMCEGAQCCEKGEWIDNLPSCEELQREGKCGGCFKFHVSPNPETLYCCNKHYSSDRKLEEKPVQEKPAVKADPNQTCGDHCTKYLNYAFNHGITPDDMSSWCTDGLNLCYSGNCMDDCKFNFHDVRHWDNVDCNQVCQGASQSALLI